MTDENPKRRWCRLTPDRFVIALLVVECLLWLSERFQWPTWHKGYAVLIAVAAVAAAFLLMLFWFVVCMLFHWWFQFGIRSLLILTVAVAIPCSWLTAAMKAAKEQGQAVDEIKKLGGSVGYDWEFDAAGTNRLNAQPPGPEWLRKLLRDDFLEAVVWVDVYSNEMTDARLAHLARLTQLKDLNLRNTQITDAGLAHLSGLNQLRGLAIQENTQITNAGLAHLSGLNQLRGLYLKDTRP